MKKTNGKTKSVTLEDGILASSPPNLKPRVKAVLSEVNGRYFVEFYKIEIAQIPDRGGCLPGHSESAHVQEALVRVYGMY